MTLAKFVKQILKIFRIYRWFIPLTILLFAWLGYIYVKQKAPTYTSKTTIFPETEAAQAPSVNGQITKLIGGAGVSNDDINFDKSLSVGIMALANSQLIKSEISLMKPISSDKTYLELLMSDVNKYKMTWEKKDSIKTNDIDQLKMIGAAYISGAVTTSVNSKAKLLEITTTTSNNDYNIELNKDFTTLLEKYFIENKLQKNREDLAFINNKIDSAQYVDLSYQRKMIQFQNQTLYVKETDITYKLPMEDLKIERERIKTYLEVLLGQKADLEWSLQKNKPYFRVLDEAKIYRGYSTIPKKPVMIQFAILGTLIIFLLLCIPAILKFCNALIKEKIKELTTEQIVSQPEQIQQ